MTFDEIAQLLDKLTPEQLEWIKYLAQDAKFLLQMGVPDNEVASAIELKHLVYTDAQKPAPVGRPPTAEAKPARELIPIYAQLQRRAGVANIHARALQVKGEHTAKDIKRQYHSQKGKCWWCGKPVYLEFDVDHRVPLAKGGQNDAGNLVISCPHCNRSKCDKMPSEFNGRLL